MPQRTPERFPCCPPLFAEADRENEKKAATEAAAAKRKLRRDFLSFSGTIFSVAVFTISPFPSDRIDLHRFALSPERFARLCVRNQFRRIGTDLIRPPAKSGMAQAEWHAYGGG